MAGAGESERRYLRFILLGAHGVGKTAIAQRFALDKFPALYKQTVGMDFYKGDVTVNNGLP